MYLGIDLGSSSLKAILVDEEQRIIASANYSLTMQHPHFGWSEQKPEEWICALEKVVVCLRKSYQKEFSAIKSIGLSGQMHGATLLDKSNKVLRPCILWNDTRSAEQAQELSNDVDFINITGNLVFAGFTAPKIYWLKQYEPKVFDKINKILLPKDYLRFYLSGEYISDYSDSSGTSWLNVGKRMWSEKLLKKTGLEISQMPKLVEGSDVGGSIRLKIAKKWGLSSNVILAGGAGDNAASAIAMGISNKGDSFLSLGTSGVIFSACDSFVSAPQLAVHSFCHAIPNKWHQMGVMLSASCLSWFANLMKCSINELMSDLEDVSFKDYRDLQVVFLPYLAGERTPHNDENIRGSFHNLSHSTGRKQMTLAILSGVSYALYDNLLALQKSGIHFSEIFAVGGGIQSEQWLQLIADVFNFPILTNESANLGAAMGAARLAMLAKDEKSIDEIILKPTVSRRYLPNHEYNQFHQEKHRQFTQYYQLLRKDK